MAHDNYDKFYTWDKGTLILDPGVFAWDEPHVQVCDRPLPFANALDKIADQKFSKSCDYPARLLSTQHSSAPASVLEQCETIVPGRAYCCPPYVMPGNWRMDYLTMDYDPTSLGQEENGMENGIFASPQSGLFEGRSFTEGIFETMTDESRAVYKLINEEIEEVPAIVEPVVEPARQTVRRWPLASLGLGIAAGLIVGKILAR